MRDEDSEQFPDGKIDETDEGALLLKMGIKGRAVVIHFGKPTVWIGFGVSDARVMAAKLVQLADRIDAENKGAS